MDRFIESHIESSDGSSHLANGHDHETIMAVKRTEFA